MKSKSKLKAFKSKLKAPCSPQVHGWGEALLSRVVLGGLGDALRARHGLVADGAGVRLAAQSCVLEWAERGRGAGAFSLFAQPPPPPAPDASAPPWPRPRPVAPPACP